MSGTRAISRRVLVRAAVAALAPAVAACGGDAAPAPPPPAATTPLPAARTATPAPAAVAPTVAAAPAAGSITFTVDATKSVATFRVNEQLVGRDLPNDAVGTAKAVTGAITLDASGRIDPGTSKVTVDMNAFQSDSSMRDGFIKRSTLEVSKYPSAVFVPSSSEGLPSPIPERGEATFTLAGILTIHGVAKPVTWDVTARRDGKAVTGKATTTVTFGDFGMTPPRAGSVVSVKDEIRLEIDLALAAP